MKSTIWSGYRVAQTHLGSVRLPFSAWILRSHFRIIKFPPTPANLRRPKRRCASTKKAGKCLVPFISKTLDTAKYSFLACRLSIMTFNAIFVCIKCSKELDADAKIELHPCGHTVCRDCLIVRHAERGAETLTCLCLSEATSHTWTCQSKTLTGKRTRATAKLDDDYERADSELQHTACTKGSHPIWDAQ